ncbi:MAG: hypothetical protein ACREH3_09300 [Geminicoccales bacterium]
MAENVTPALEKLLRDAECRFERQGKGDHEIRYGPIRKDAAPGQDIANKTSPEDDGV